MYVEDLEEFKQLQRLCIKAGPSPTVHQAKEMRRLADEILKSDLRPQEELDGH